jgi:GAF domain-containing protein
LDKAHALCSATLGTLFLFDGDKFRAAATHGYPEKLARRLREGIDPRADTSAFTPLIEGARLVTYPDLRELDDPLARAVSGPGGVRTNLLLPLRKDGRVLGMISCNRIEVRPYTEKEIALLENFAAQAVIAMENARLLTETREALEQQTATAEVLGVINASPGDLAPVFDAMLEKAMRLCTAAFGYLMTYDGEHFAPVARRGLPVPFAEYLSRMDQPGSSGAYARIIGGADLVHVPDLQEGDVYRTSPLRQALVDLGGARTGLIVALRKEASLLGVFTIYRQEVRPFSDKETALLQNFAAQAVIAMENARLITETREALEQQTATAEVLGVINASPGDLAPVFDAILEKAHSLCGIATGALSLLEDGVARTMAIRGAPKAYAEVMARPFRPPPGSPLAQLIEGAPFVQIADMAEHARQSPGDARGEAIAAAGLRTSLFVALRRERELIGYVTAYRREVRPFADKEIALLRNFAGQAA